MSAQTSSSVRHSEADSGPLRDNSPSISRSTRGGRRFPLPIRIAEGFMRLEINGRVVVTPPSGLAGCWEVTYWPRFFDRNRAITALTMTGLPGVRPRQQRPACQRAPRRTAMTDRQQ